MADCNFATMGSRDHMIAADEAMRNTTGVEIQENLMQLAQLHLLAALAKSVTKLAETIASKE